MYSWQARRTYPYHEQIVYNWNVLGLCEMNWKGIGETTTHKGHKLYFSGRDDGHEEGLGFFVHKNTEN